MTKRIGPILIITPEPEQQCDDCGKVAELRPYGPPGDDGLPTMICYDCGMKDIVGTRRRFAQRMLGVPDHQIGDDGFPK